MQNILKNKSVVIAGVVLVVALAFVFFWGRSQAASSSIAVQTSASATTTVSYIYPGSATTTYQFDSSSLASGKVPFTSPFDSEYLFVQYAATSSAAVLAVTPQYSNNGIDWYGFGTLGTTNLANGNSLVASSSASYLLSSGSTTGTTSVAFKLPDMSAQHMRVVFSVPLGGVGVAVYNEVVLKQNPHSP